MSQNRCRPNSVRGVNRETMTVGVDRLIADDFSQQAAKKQGRLGFFSEIPIRNALDTRRGRADFRSRRRWKSSV